MNMNTHIFCSVTFFFENRAVYETKWKNVLEPDMPQMTVLHVRVSCWMSKAKIHSQNM